ncbi:MAG: hypothetical protein ACKVUS_10070 [Saprospiraceae bacterium]
MKKSLLFFVALFASIAAFESCKKEDNNDQVIATAEDISANEDYAEQIDLDADIAVEERGGGDCPTVTFAQPEGTWPNTITIDYGTACTRPDGRVLSGKLIVNQTAEIRTPGAVRTTTHDNFFVDGVQVEGTKTWTNNGQNADSQWSYTKVATDMKLTFEDGSLTAWSKTRNSTLIEGGSTATHLDDVWRSTGTASGLNRNGRDFTATITEPLVKRAACRWISAGVIEFKVGDRTRSLDFGDGTCDRFGTITLANGESFSIRLRR